MVLGKLAAALALELFRKHIEDKVAMPAVGPVVFRDAPPPRGFTQAPGRPVLVLPDYPLLPAFSLLGEGQQSGIPPVECHDA